MSDVWWFVLGCFVGATVGFFTAAMMAVAKGDGEESERNDLFRQCFDNKD